ncbi:hypothetical protein BH23GEM9_BH23GEM9_32530 [soil metagenome]
MVGHTQVLSALFGKEAIKNEAHLRVVERARN